MDWKSKFQGKKVLVAEDDPINQEVIKDILEGMGCMVKIAQDGNEVVDHFQKGSFDLILMDVRMPNKDGIQATREIRSLEKWGKQIPIFALTASVIEADRREVIAGGATEFLSKPIILEELREKMKKILG